jgi:hypothetical protein
LFLFLLHRQEDEVEVRLSRLLQRRTKKEEDEERVEVGDERSEDVAGDLEVGGSDLM